MTSQQDNRTTAACTIEWFEDAASGRSYYLARFDDGGACEISEEAAGADGPISASTDYDVIAHAVAGELSLECLSVERDGEFIHATMRQL